MTYSDDSHHDGFDGNPPASLLPYAQWIENAYREVMLNAVSHVIENGLPGNHSFYLTYKTTYPGVEIPARVKAQYPDEITIVLQHQFWDLKVDRLKRHISVGLSFGGVGTTLVIPFGAITGFTDPEANLAFSFQPIPPPFAPVDFTSDLEEVSLPTEDEAITEKEEKNDTKIVSLDLFRKKTE